MTVSEQLVTFSQSLKFEDIPAEVIGVAKEHILDALGIAIASTRMDYGTSAFEAANCLGSGRESTVIGFGGTMPASSAALVNGTLIHGLDFDDTHIASIVHATAPALAAALAVAERERVNGRQLLSGFVVGIESAIRLGLAGAGCFHDRGFHPTGLCGTFAAALAASKLAHATEVQANDAIGLCGSMAAGNLQTTGSWQKRMHPGWAAHAGIVAAEMGRRGFKGSRQVLDGPYGFYASHMGRIPEEISAVTKELGVRWHSSDTALKPYPCCHYTHAFIDCGKEIRQGKVFAEHALDDIDLVKCKISSRIAPKMFEPRAAKTRPQTTYDALFSVPYVTACMLVKGRVSLSTFYDESYDDPDVLNLSDKIVWEDDPDSTHPKHFPGEVTVFFKDGSRANARVDINRGGPGNPMAQTEIEEKFLGNATRAMKRDQALQVIELVNGLEKVNQISQLTDVLTIRT